MLDSADGGGTLPGALLRTLVAQESCAFTDQEDCQMVLIAFPPSAEPCRGVRCALTTPVVHVEGTRTVVALRGEADIPIEHFLCHVLSHGATASAFVKRPREEQGVTTRRRSIEPQSGAQSRRSEGIRP